MTSSFPSGANEDLFDQTLYADVKSLISAARERVSYAIDNTLTLLHWRVGNRIKQEVLQNKRADYGKEIISNLAKVLAVEFGDGFGRTNLFYMLRFAEAYPDEKIVHALSGQLRWTHFKQLIYIEDELKRKFYTELCRIERWSTRVLDKKIQSMLFERTAISQKTDEVIAAELKKVEESDVLTPDMVFRDPYVLNFLRLPQGYSESDLEQAILNELSAFIQEFGTDFCFMARQKRITIDNEDYAIDLLFYHRGLRRIICIELKLGRFTAAHKGQMELYLRWLDKYERKPGEEKPLGIVLCAEKKQEHIELLELDKSGIHVAAYLTDLPAKEVLENRLHEAIRLAKEKIQQQQLAHQTPTQQERDN